MAKKVVWTSPPTRTYYQAEYWDNGLSKWLTLGNHSTSAFSDKEDAVGYADEYSNTTRIPTRVVEVTDDMPAPPNTPPVPQKEFDDCPDAFCDLKAYDSHKFGHRQRGE